MQTRRILAAVLPALFALSAAASEIWYEDNNLGKAGGMPADFVEKFRQPETFAQATRYIRVYMMRANVLEKMDDAFFTTLLGPYLKKNNVKLAVNAGGATWGQLPQRAAIAKTELELFRRMKRLGIQVDYFSLQSVLSKPRKGDGADYPLNKRIDDVVAFSKALREIYPQAQIGIIDALASHGKEYRQPFRQARDAMAKAGLTLSYIHLDMNFNIVHQGRSGVTWQAIRDLEAYIEDELGLQFGYFTKSRKGGQTSSKEFHQGVMAAMECYLGMGGSPRDLIVASNFQHPRTTIPETATGDEYPFMRTVLAYGRRLEEIKKAGAAAAQRSREPEWRAMCLAY